MPQQPQGLTSADWETAKPLTSSDWDQAKPLTAQTEKPSGHGVASGVADFLSGLWEKQPIHPIDMAQSMLKMGLDTNQAFNSTMAGKPQAPEFVKSLLSAQGVPFANAEAAFRKGDYAQGVTSLLNWLIPVIGPQNEQAQQQVMSGQISGPKFVGQELGLAGQVVAPGAMKNLRPSIPAIARNPNPVTAEAVAFGQSRGIPVDAATATGSRPIGAIQAMSNRSLGGLLAGGEQAQAAQAAGLSRVGGELASQAHPVPVTPAEAGQAVRGAVSDVVTDLHAQANQAYDVVRAAEKLPKNARVVTNTRQVPTGLFDASGQPITKAVTSSESIPLPVDLGGVKAALKPIYDTLRRQLPVTQQQASPGLKALQNIIDGPDMAPLSQVETDLGAIKAMTRGAEMPELRGIGRGVAAKAVSELDDAAMAVANKAGVGDALRAGRAATASKYRAGEVIEQLKAEPVRIFNQTTYAKDAGIAQLQEIAKLAPAELPKVGRAFLDDLMTQATAEGGFDKARTLATKWANLGDQTKALLFKDPAYIKDLDNFFLLAKKMGENPNPSGTAHNVLTMGQLGLLYTNPMTGAASILGTGALSKLLHSRAGVAALTRGISLPIGNAAASSSVLGTLNQAIEMPASMPLMMPSPVHAQRQGGGQ